jgi:hypothetical protein
MRLLPVVLVAVATGCVTPYGPRGVMGGYSERQLNRNTWEVSFAGNGYTGTGTTRNGALRRAAEIARAAGAPGFIVRSGGTEVSTSTIRQPVICNRIGNSVTCSGGDHDVNKPETLLVVTVLTAEQAGAASAAGQLVYDPAILLARAAVEDASAAKATAESRCTPQMKLTYGCSAVAGPAPARPTQESVTSSGPGASAPAHVSAACASNGMTDCH